MKEHMWRMFDMHADLCKVLANPKRLMIIDLLSSGERSVGELAGYLGVQSSTVSQHLRVLRDRQLVGLRKEGQTTYYHLTAPRIIDVCGTMRGILLESMKQRGEIAGDFGMNEVTLLKGEGAE